MSKNKPYKSVKVQIKIKKNGELKKPKYAVDNIAKEQLEECKKMITMRPRDFHPTLSKHEKMELWGRMGGSIFNYPKEKVLDSFRTFARQNVAYELEIRKQEKMNK